MKQHFELIIQHLREPLLLTTPTGIIVSANVAAAEALGTTLQLLHGANLSAFAVEPSYFAERMRAAFGGTTTAFALCDAAGQVFFCDARALEDEIILVRLAGDPEPISENAVRAVAEVSRRRAEFLANAGMILGASLDYEATLASVARAAVPSVADWCVVEFAGWRAPDAPIVAAHADPTKLDSVLALRRHFRKTPGVSFGIDAVVEFGRSRLHPRISLEMIDALFPDAPDFARLCRLVGVSSAMVVPMAARGRTLGAILLVNAERAYGEHDLAMAEELGRRAGVAVDNARLYSEACDADRRKDEFLAMLGHELRNPLAPIRTALDLMTLRAGDLFELERTIIDRQVKHLVSLVDDLLDVSRVTRGKIELRKEVVEIARVVGRAVEMASPLLEQRCHELTLAVPGTGLPVLADVRRLSQAIANMLVNAAKFTEPKGQIALSAVREASDVVVRVRDSGIGIATEKLTEIFEPFFQGNRFFDRSRGGLGIGLTIVKSLVRLHGGTVAAHSDGTGRGSEFVIRLDLADELGTSVRRPAIPDAPVATTMHGRRILVVDDNADAASLLAEALEQIGACTRVACDGPSALAVVAAFEPEVVLLDIGLPVMNGYEVARRLRALTVTAGTRLVAITGYGQEADHARSKAAGFDEHVAKPVELGTLCEILARLDEEA